MSGAAELKLAVKRRGNEAVPRHSPRSHDPLVESRNRYSPNEAAFDLSVGVALGAKTAGVGRVTLYGHFPNRADLVEAALARAIEEGHAALDAVDLTGDPREALSRLIDSSWLLVNRSRSLLLAAQGVLPPGRIRALHAGPAERVERLVKRGQDEGVFRSDLSTPWLVGVMHNVMHNAADEINAGRLDTGRASRFITATVLAAFTPPGQPVRG